MPMPVGCESADANLIPVPGLAFVRQPAVADGQLCYNTAVFVVCRGMGLWVWNNWRW